MAKLFAIFISIILLGCVSSERSQDTGQVSKSSTFVLVHAAWLGGWSWGYVTPYLEKAGHKVVVFDLPGHGQDKTPPSEVTMSSYVDTVVDIIDKQSGPVVLVGHSFAGVIISQIAEARPHKVDSLGYLCAFLLPDGASFVKATEGVKGSKVLDNIVFSEDKTYVTVKEEFMHDAFAHDVTEKAFLDAKKHIVPEPTAPLATPLDISEEKWGSVPRYYIECKYDNALPNKIQKAMYTSIPVEKVYSLNTSHSPIFSAPLKVAEYLLDIAN